MRTSNRPQGKQDEIISYLRTQILEGVAAPGERLPTRSDIEERFHTTSVTVQRAFDRLISDGFVVTRGSQGSFVAADPPHLCRYALVFPCHPHDAHWVYFWTVLCDVARELESATTLRFSTHYGVETNPNAEGFQSLAADVEAHRLAGIIFAALPHGLLRAPLLQDCPVPCVSLMGGEKTAQILRVDFGGEPSFGERAVDYLIERGRRRIALLCLAQAREQPTAIERVLARHGLDLPARWRHGLHQAYADWAENLMQMLFHDSPDQRPDGLIIHDDNLVEHACAGLIKAGVRVPDDVEVVAHCNFPPPKPDVLPIARLGYDLRTVLAKAIELTRQARAGLNHASSIHIQAEFSWEIEQPAPMM